MLPKTLSSVVRCVGCRSAPSLLVVGPQRVAASVPVHAKVAVRWSSDVSDFMEIEKQLGAMQREVRDALRAGDLSAASDGAAAFRDAVAEHYGERHPVFASALNNQALCAKQMGKLPDAAELYEQALALYEDLVGDDHPSTITTLTNLGTLYRAMADDAKGMDKLTLVDTAVGFLERALSLRERVLQESDPSIGLAMAHTAAAYRLQRRTREAESMLMDAAERLRKHGHDQHPHLGLVLNNLGYLLKESNSELDRAERCYREALSIRQTTLGATHPETISTQHNLAELLITNGNETEAAELQADILIKLGVDPSSLPSENQ